MEVTRVDPGQAAYWLLVLPAADMPGIQELWARVSAWFPLAWPLGPSNHGGYDSLQAHGVCQGTSNDTGTGTTAEEKWLQPKPIAEASLPPPEPSRRPRSRLSRSSPRPGTPKPRR